MRLQLCFPGEDYISIRSSVNANAPALYVRRVDSGATGQRSTLMAAGYLALLAKCKYTAIDVRLSAAHARRGAFLRLERARLH